MKKRIISQVARLVRIWCKSKIAIYIETDKERERERTESGFRGTVAIPSDPARRDMNFATAFVSVALSVFRQCMPTKTSPRFILCCSWKMLDPKWPHLRRAPVECVWLDFVPCHVNFNKSHRSFIDSFIDVYVVYIVYMVCDTLIATYTIYTTYIPHIPHVPLLLTPRVAGSSQVPWHKGF